MSVENVQRIAAGVAEMLEEPPNDWWRYVPCGVCMSLRGETCIKGGASWPEPLGRPHASRQRAGLVLHATLWLLGRFPEDVLGAELPPRAVSPDRVAEYDTAAWARLREACRLAADADSGALAVPRSDGRALPGVVGPDDEGESL